MFTQLTPELLVSSPHPLITPSSLPPPALITGMPSADLSPWKPSLAAHTHLGLEPQANSLSNLRWWKGLGEGLSILLHRGSQLGFWTREMGWQVTLSTSSWAQPQSRAL